MVKKNPALQPVQGNIIVRNYVSQLTLNKAIQSIYPECNKFTYPHGEAGQVFSDRRFVSFNGRIGEVVYAYCDFQDKRKVPLSATNRDDLLKLRLIQLKQNGE